MNSVLSDAAFWHRLQFGFTIIYHYLFPQLTMGLACFLVYWKWRGLPRRLEKNKLGVRVWAEIIAVNFSLGVVNRICMEGPFGHNYVESFNYIHGFIWCTIAM